MPYIAQNVLQGPSGLPEDRYVNTFNFSGAAEPGHVAAADLIKNMLQDFYTLPPPDGGGNALQAYMPNFVADLAQVRVYRWQDAVPREAQIRTYPFAGAAPAPLPSEVALCASYYATRNLPRQRGRIYLGPLTTFGLLSLPGQPSRPALDLVATLAAASKRLVVQSEANGLSWTVRSAVGAVATFSKIDNGWVDNAWDTQRRRGEDATSRTTWNVPIPVP